MGPWAGTQIICVGNTCFPGDWPAGLLTAEEEELVNEGLTGCAWEFDSGEVDLIGRRFREVRQSEVKSYQKLLGPVLNKAEHLPHSEYIQVLSFALDSPKMADYYYPKAESWILRNLTASEFIQGDKLFTAFERSEPPDGPQLGYPGFCEAIACRICWSTSSDSIVPRAGMSCGVWAGQRFEICTEKIHALNSDDNWKDVTSEIVEELSATLGIPIQTKEGQEGQSLETME